MVVAVDDAQRPTEGQPGIGVDPGADPAGPVPDGRAPTVAGPAAPLPMAEQPPAGDLVLRAEPPRDAVARTKGRRPARRERIDVGPGPAAVVLGGFVLGLAPPIAVAVAASLTTVPTLRWLALPAHLALVGLGSWIVGMLLVARDMMRP